MTVDPVPAKVVHSLLRQELGPAMKAAGYKAGRSGRWHRPHGRDAVCVFHAALTVYGWDEFVGSEFMVRYYLAPTLEEAQNDGPRTTLIDLSAVLTEEDLRDMHRRNERVAAALPPLSSVPADSDVRRFNSPEDWEAFLDMRPGPVP